MSKLHLILAFHNHQPVGNFDHVLEDCYHKSYLPFLETLLEHPGLKVVLHYSGHLLSWIHKRHPEAFGIIKDLVRTQRAEILSGGFYEPVISVLPEKDRSLQITELTKFIKKNLGYAAKGMWLAERVWEPQMPRFIAKAGLGYLPIDDYHFKLTGMEERDLLGYYLTEDEGRRISVFPGSEKLRYFIPFRTIDEILSYFREVSMRGGSPLLTMADDGEKFGVWPNTHKHCYEDGWLDNFFSALEDNSDWIETTTFSEYHSKFPPLGKVYLPTASYREMGEWTLPAEAGLEYENLLEELQKVAGDKAKQLIRGGIWRSFMVKYPEANHIHKRMFFISGKVHEAAKKLKAESEKSKVSSEKSSPHSSRLTPNDLFHELWMGQCNDAYWHGIFGGLYLPHLRSALYRHLLRAEAAAGDVLKEPLAVHCSDFDCDGFEDIIVGTKHLTLAFTEKGGSMTEFSLKKQAVNMLDILSRRPEAYHSKLAKAADSGGQGTKTIHDQFTAKEAGLSDFLVYDGYRRSSLIDHFLPSRTRLGEMASSAYEELGDFVGKPYSMTHAVKGGRATVSLEREGLTKQGGIRLEKKIAVAGKKEVRVDYLIEGAYEGLFAVEMNISFLGSPHALIRAGGKTLTIRNTGVYERTRGFSLADEYLNLGIDFAFDEKIGLWHYPVETISLSEQGIERLYQGTAFLFVTALDLQGGKKKFGFTIKFGEDKK